MRAKGGELTGPNPVDGGKPGSKLCLLSNANGLPLVVGITTANTHNGSHHFAAFPSLAATLTCLKKLAKLTK